VKRENLVVVFVILLIASGANAQVFELGTLEVYGSRLDLLRDEPSSCSLIFPSQYEGEFKDLGELLSKIPGVRVTKLGGRGSYTVVSIRGSTAGQVAIYLNGILMNMGGEGAVDLSTIPLSAVERIEVYRGSVPARFGISGIGGVINIVTFEESKFNVVKASAGSFRSYSAESINNVGKALISLNLECSRGDYLYDNDNGTPFNPSDDYEARRQNNAYRLNDIKISRKVGDRTKIFLNYFSKHRELPKPAPGSDRDDFVSRSNLSEERFLGEITTNFRLSNKTMGAFSIYGLLSEREFRNPYGDIGWGGQKHNWYNSYKLGGRASLNYLLSEEGLLEAYLDFSFEKLIPGGDIVSQGYWSPLKGVSEYERGLINFSLDYNISKGKLILVPWVRFLSLWESSKKLDGVEENSTDDSFCYGIRSKYILDENWAIKATWGKAVRLPTFYEKFGDGAFILPNPGLKSERGENFDFGLEYMSKDLMISVTYFRSDIDDLIEFVMANPKFAYYKNIKGAKVEGIELEFSKVWSMGWSANLSYTYMRSRSEILGYREGKPLPNRPEHSVSLRLARSWKDWEFFVEGEFIGENYFDTGGLVKFSDWWELNLGLSHELSEKEKLSLVIKNLTNNQDLRVKPVGYGPEKMPDYPPIGRAFYLTYIKNF